MVLIAARGGYDPQAIGAGTEEYRRVALAGFGTAAIAAISLYLLKLDLSRIFFVTAFVLGTVGLLLGRVALRASVRRARAHGRLTHRVLVAGHPARISELCRVLMGDKGLGYEVVGALTHTTDSEVGDIPVVGTIDSLPDTAIRLGAESVIVAEDAFHTATDLRRTAWGLADSQIQLVVAPGIHEISSDRLTVRPVGGLPLMHVDRRATTTSATTSSGRSTSSAPLSRSCWRSRCSPTSPGRSSSTTADRSSSARPAWASTARPSRA